MAVAQLQYEIDNEVVETAMKIGNKTNNIVGKWYSAQPVGVSMRDHFESILDLVARADAKLYENTMKFASTYILCGINALRFFNMCTGFKAAPAKSFMGPFIAGEVAGKTVVVSPACPQNMIYFGVNTPEASALIYATYMPIAPTQLLQGPDGTTTQGYSTAYDIKELNESLIVRAEIVSGVNPALVATVEDGTYGTTPGASVDYYEMAIARNQK